MYCVANEPSQVAVVNFSQWTDEELILEYQVTQNRSAFEELVQRYERELFNFLRNYLGGDSESAEDVFQTTFLQVHLKCDLFEKGRTFRPWLYRIATNQAIDLRRRTKRYQVVSLDESPTGEESGSLANLIGGNEKDPSHAPISDEQAKQLREAMEQLPDLLKQVLYMVYFQGMKYRDAAETLGVPFGTVKSRINAAVKKLNILLADDV